MVRAEINWDQIPPSLRVERPVRVCLKCGFDIFTKQLGLAPRTAYSEMRKFTPDPAAFRAEPQRPLFRSPEAGVPCPYCGAAKRWVATLRAVEIEAHRDVAKETRKLLAALKRKPEQYVIRKDARSPVEVFSDWLDRLSLAFDFTGEIWLRDAAIAWLERCEPSSDWADAANISRIHPSRRLAEGWEREGHRLYLSPALYGDVLVVQYLLSRTHLHGGVTFEGRLTPFEFFHHLRRHGYLTARGIEADDPPALLEGAIAHLAAVGEIKPHLVIDRTAYLELLKKTYDRLKK
jgi:hypothetical protein